ncbi:nucleotide exchange factor GrpE [Planctomycetota bacterium]
MHPADPHIPITDGDASSIPAEATDSMPNTESSPASSTEAGSADITRLRQQLAALKNDNLRLRAELDNYIKRSERNAEQQAAVEKEGFIIDLLLIIDNLERALASRKDDSSDPLFHGVRMTLQQLGQLLGKHGIEPVADQGRPFDPHRHEAVSVQCDPTQANGIVLNVTQRGYWRGDQVFRPAKVIVNDLSRYAGDRHAR